MNETYTCRQCGARFHAPNSTDLEWSTYCTLRCAADAAREYDAAHPLPTPAEVAAMFAAAGEPDPFKGD